MKILVLLLCIVALSLAQNIVWQGDYDTLPSVAGLDFVGFGYDARFAELSDALQVPIMDFSYTQHKAYFYPANRTAVFRVPDEILVRTIAFTEATAYLYNSVEEILDKMTTETGVDFAQEVALSNSSAICVTTTKGNDTTENCTTTSTFNNTKLFSNGAQMKYVKENFQKNEIYQVENAETTQLFGMFLDNRFIKSYVLEDMQNLLSLSFDSNPAPFFKFLEKYGTHYVASAVMGGKVTMETTIDRSFTSNTVTEGTSTTSVTTQEALAGATSVFQSAIGGNSDFSLSDAQKKTQFSLTSDWKLAGGDSSLVNLLDTRQSSDAIKTWKKSIPSNPVPVQYRIRSMATLFKDPFIRSHVKSAIAVYLTFETSDILKIAFNTTTGGWSQIN